VKTVQDQLKQEIISSLTYNFRDDISKIVSDYVKNNMADDIKKMLDIEKPNMLTEIQKSCTTIAAENSIILNCNILYNVCIRLPNGDFISFNKNN